MPDQLGVEPLPRLSRADLPLLAQLLPGDTVNFTPVKLDN